MNELTRPSVSDAKPLYRRLYCRHCKHETWHQWHIGHEWTCSCGVVKVEDVWNHHLPIEPLPVAPEQPALF